MDEFQTTGPITVDIRLRGGEVIVTAEERETATVEVTPADGASTSRDAAEQTSVEMRRGTLSIHAGDGGLWRHGGSIRVIARVPLDSTMALRTASADAALYGRWREGQLHTASGDVRVDEVTGNLTGTTASGEITVDRVGGSLRLQSASGDLDVGAVGGDASLHSASGAISVGDTGASVQARTASGSVDLHHARHGELRVQTVSGDVTISVLPGTGVYFDVSTVSGRTGSDLTVRDAPGTGHRGQLTLRIRTVSGDVLVVRAAEPADPADTAQRADIAQT